MKIPFLKVILAAALFVSPAGHAASTEGTTGPGDENPEWTLDQCLEIAARGNPEILQAATGFTDAKGQAIQLRSFLYPQIGATVVSTPPTIYVRVEQVLYDRSIGPLLKLSRLTSVEADLNYKQALTEVLFRTRQCFAVNLACQEKILLLENYLARSRKSIERSNQLFDAGRIQKSDILRIEVDANLAEQQLLQARSEKHQALLEMGKILGRQIPDTTRFKGVLGRESLSDLDVERLTIEAFLNRPDYLALKAAKEEGRQRILLSTRSLYPRVGFRSTPAIQPAVLGAARDYDLNRNDNEPSVQRKDGNTQIPLSLFVFWTFFDGGESSGLKQTAEAKLASRSEALEALNRSIPGQIRSTLEILNLSQQSLETLVLGPEPEKMRENADADYQNGKIRLLDQIQMEKSILDRENQILDARLNYSLSVAALDRSLGRVVQFK